MAIFGIGGVGSYVVEGLARAGVGCFILVDHDVVSVSNLNRQLIATQKTIGMPKVQVAMERILEINPEAKVQTFQEFFMPMQKIESVKELESLKESQNVQTIGTIENGNQNRTILEAMKGSADYIVDAIDTVSAKIALIVWAKKQQIPVISSMGTGNKLDPTKLEVTDLFKTSVCPLAKVMRKELKARNISSLKVVYSSELPLKPIVKDTKEKLSKMVGSVSFVPSVAGLIMAGEVVKDILKRDLT